MTEDHKVIQFNGGNAFGRATQFCQREDVVPLSIAHSNSLEYVVLYKNKEPPMGIYLGKVPEYTEIIGCQATEVKPNSERQQPKYDQLKVTVIENLKKEFYKSRSKILCSMLNAKSYSSLTGLDMYEESIKLKAILEQLKKAGIEMTL